MDFTWIVVGLAGWALALVFVLVLMRMAGQQDRSARHGEKTLDPFSEVTITRLENVTMSENVTKGKNVAKVDEAKFTTVYGNESNNGTTPGSDEAPKDSPPNR